MYDLLILLVLLSSHMYDFLILLGLLSSYMNDFVLLLVLLSIVHAYLPETHNIT